MFEQIAVSAVVAVFVAILVGAILRQTVPSYGGARTWADFGNYAAPDGVTNWISPALVLVALTQVKRDAPELENAGYQTWLIAAVIAGLVSVVMARPGLRTLRDLFLSLCAGILAVVLLRQYVLSSEASVVPAAAMVGIFAVAFIFGVLLNILRTFNIPRLGLAALGAIEILLFLVYPFNIEILREVPMELHLVLLLVAALLGVGAAAAPSFLIPLGGIAICAAEVGVTVYEWFISQGGPVDWNGALVIIGTQLGVALGIFARGMIRV